MGVAGHVVLIPVLHLAVSYLFLLAMEIGDIQILQCNLLFSFRRISLIMGSFSGLPDIQNQLHLMFVLKDTDT